MQRSISTHTISFLRSAPRGSSILTSRQPSTAILAPSSCPAHMCPCSLPHSSNSSSSVCIRSGPCARVGSEGKYRGQFGANVVRRVARYPAEERQRAEAVRRARAVVALLVGEGDERIELVVDVS